MITNEHWLAFISQFFGYDPKWIKHVVDHWNYITNTPGCNCRSWEKCEVWEERQKFLEQYGRDDIDEDMTLVVGAISNLDSDVQHDKE